MQRENEELRGAVDRLRDENEQRAVTHAQLQQRYTELYVHCLDITNDHNALIDAYNAVCDELEIANLREKARSALAFISESLALIGIQAEAPPDFDTQPFRTFS